MRAKRRPASFSPPRPGFLLAGHRGEFMKRHVRENYYVVGEGILATTRSIADLPPALRRSGPAQVPLLPPGRQGAGPPGAVPAGAGRGDDGDGNPDSAGIPAGFTYLGQFVDHDLTLDKTAPQPGPGGHRRRADAGPFAGARPRLAVRPGPASRGRHLLQRRRRLHGTHPADPICPRLAPTSTSRGSTCRGPAPARQGGAPARRRSPTRATTRTWPSRRLHLAFIRFHNGVVDLCDRPSVTGYAAVQAARGLVVKHYQWMLRTDFLPRVSIRRSSTTSSPMAGSSSRWTPRPGDRRPCRSILGRGVPARPQHDPRSYEWNAFSTGPAS